MRSSLLLLALLSLLQPHRATAAISLDQLVVSPSAALDLWASGAEIVVGDGDVLRYSDVGPGVVALGLPAGVGVSALHIEPDGDVLFAIDTPALLGGALFEPRDVVRFDGSTYTRHFHGAARGIPTFVGIDGFSRSGGDDLISFDFEVLAGALLVFPEDVVRWTPGQPQLELDASQLGVPFGLNLDAVAALDDGTLMVSFALPLVLQGMFFEPSSTARLDPATGTWSTGVTLSDFDPDWGALGLDALHAVIGVAHVDAPRPAEVGVIVIEPEPPRAYELRLDCGAHAVERISTGLVLNPGVLASGVTIGDCTVSSCPGQAGFGPSVDPGSVSIDFPPHAGTERADTIYVTLDGVPRLCTPGQSVLLAQISARGSGAAALPAPLATGEKAADSRRENSALLEPRQIAHFAGQEAPDWTVRVRPALGSTSGLDHEVVLDGPVELHRIGLALLLPGSVSAAQVDFGGCTKSIGPDEARGCGDADALGPWVDDQSSSTLGPAPGLLALGGHPDAIYLDLVGSRPGPGLPALSFSTRRVLLGRIRYDASVPAADRRVPLPLIAGTGSGDGAIVVSIDTLGLQVPPIGGGGGVGDPVEGGSVGDDSDPEDIDPCPGSADDTDSGGVATSDPDGIGDDCQCGDLTSAGFALPGFLPGPDGIIDAADADGLRSALTGSDQVLQGGQIKCSVNGPVDAAQAPDLPLRGDCELSDSVVLRRVLAAAGPGPVASELQQCAAP